jgi:hypothetical protein
VKPRFGSWGQEVHLSRDEDELRALLEPFTSAATALLRRAAARETATSRRREQPVHAEAVGDDVHTEYSADCLGAVGFAALP